MRRDPLLVVYAGLCLSTMGFFLVSSLYFAGVRL